MRLVSQNVSLIALMPLGEYGTTVLSKRISGGQEVPSGISMANELNTTLGCGVLKLFEVLGLLLRQELVNLNDVVRYHCILSCPFFRNKETLCLDPWSKEDYKFQSIKYSSFFRRCSIATNYKERRRFFDRTFSLGLEYLSAERAAGLPRKTPRCYKSQIVHYRKS